MTTVHTSDTLDYEDMSLEELFAAADAIMADPIYADDTQETDADTPVALETNVSSGFSHLSLEQLFTLSDKIFSHQIYSEKYFPKSLDK